MDYITRSTDRNELRLYAEMFKVFFGLDLNGRIEPEFLLDRLNEFFPNANYAIVEDLELPKNVPALTVLTDEGYLIKIKDSVFNGAVSKQIGGYRMHIIHEIMHIYVDKLGFKPIYARAFPSNSIPAYKSLEWIVKAISGELMIPYDATVNMSVEDIRKKYGVSKAAAEQRLKY